MTPIRRIAFVAFPRLTLLDLVGAYDALRRVATMGVDAGVSHRVIGTAAEIVDDSGFRVVPDGVYEPLAGFDLLVVPGGHGTRVLVDDARFVEWLRGWPAGRPVASVCTGSLLLGRAGLLAGRRATTHHAAYEELRPYCREVVTGARVVEDGPVVTGGGVTSAIDVGLHLVERHWGRPARERIARQMVWPG